MVSLAHIPQTNEPQKPDSGVVHHVAFASQGFAGMKQRLETKGMEYDSRQVPGGDLWQIFVNDPNGVMIELNYEDAKEQGVAAPAERRVGVGAREAFSLDRFIGRIGMARPFGNKPPFLIWSEWELVE